MYAMRFSPAALGAASIDSILINTQQSELDEQKAKQQAQDLNGKTATANGNLIQSSLMAQANTTKCNGWGEIGAGITQGGMEFGSMGYGVKRDYFNDELTTSKNGVGRLDKWQDAIEKDSPVKADEGGEAGLIAEAGAKPPVDPNELKKAEGRLAKADLDKASIEDVSEAGKTYKEDLEAAKKARGVGVEGDCIDKLQEAVKEKKKQYQGRVDSFNSTTERTQAKFTSFGQVAGNLARGIQSQKAAASTENQANIDMIKAQSQFAVDAAKSNVDGISKDLDNKKSVKDSSIQLLSSLIQENRV